MAEIEHLMTQHARSKATGGKETFVIGLIAFLTVVDLFAAQALLPSLVERYQVSPAAMSLAVNACTLGMAAAGLAVALFGQHLEPRRWIVASLIVLAVPTAALAVAPNLTEFALLRVSQGLCMATAFSLTLAYIGGHFAANTAAKAVAAYITGNVASNLIGRLIAATVVGSAGLSAAFFVFAGLNLLGAGLVFASLHRMEPAASAHEKPHGAFEALIETLKTPDLRASFGIGFCILFAFIGTFTFVNFVLVTPPLAVSMMQLGVIYFVFAPAILTTPLAGAAAQRFGTRTALLAALGAAALGLPALLSSTLPVVLGGMILVAAGTFFAQALATGYVGRHAGDKRAAASGMYLACYFLGGLAGTAILGQIFDRFGWPACVGGVALALVFACGLATRLRTA